MVLEVFGFAYPVPGKESRKPWEGEPEAITRANPLVHNGIHPLDLPLYLLDLRRGALSFFPARDLPDSANVIDQFE